MAAMDITRGTRRSRNNSRRRGILGIESAIVMIAFVVVAAALAFVVLNAGFGTTQKSKTTISEGLKSATGAVEVAGLVTGGGNSSTGKLLYYSIPIKLASGAGEVNLQQALTAVKYFSKSVNYDNIYVGTARDSSNASYADVMSMFADVKQADCTYDPSVAATDAINNSGSFQAPAKTCAIIWWSNSIQNNDILDGGEVAVLTIVFESNDQPEQLDVLHSELIISGGSVLTVERSVPVITTSVVNLG
ncbi:MULTISPECIES: archaellin/type IV pilin N-terminal domain-containing protein [Candidatus Nitrosocaldus]|jgi:flagellin FlaB|uniref:Flagellin n=1 Tax=Candidatus Nitrosocaldus cavascurensis TaxID=2058097 RepID=A0A2K5ASC1_9ARCH|nr:MULTISPECIES: archaellin/type IV pilin N-terminal domain-containing protein [Candidatus Nitrosocaldus]SPC34537.1 archaeal flagellin [Candidatus Nitrosocaldus cavascurensis]